MLDGFLNAILLLREQPDKYFKLCALYLLYETLTEPRFVEDVPIKWRLGNVKCDLYGEIIFDILPADGATVNFSSGYVAIGGIYSAFITKFNIDFGVIRAITWSQPHPYQIQCNLHADYDVFHTSHAVTAMVDNLFEVLQAPERREPTLFGVPVRKALEEIPATALLAEALATALTEQEHTVLTGALDVCLELLRTASSLSDSETALIGPLVNIRSKVAPGVPLLAIFPRHVSFVQEPNITVYNR